MKKNILPIAIILIVSVLGGLLLSSGNSTSTDAQLLAESEKLRELYLSVPDMFCAGCTSSVEGYVSSMNGVKRVSASLIDKTANVIYDPNLITTDEIIANEIFELYGVAFISDEEFTGSFLPEESSSGEEIPEELLEKSQEVVAALNEKSAAGEDTSAAQSLFNQVNSDIESGNFANAESLLDTILNILKDE